MNAALFLTAFLGVFILLNVYISSLAAATTITLESMYEARFVELEKAFQSRQDTPSIFLAHQPRYIKEVKNGVDLVLSGHTHGGQLYPFRFLVALVQPYIDGLHQHNENLQIYVNKGTGFWGPPMRLGTSSEITKITIKP